MRRLIQLFASLSILLSFHANADITLQDFTEQKFKQLQKDNALVLVDVYATWCPTCAAQQIILKQYMEARPKSDMHILKVDFDDQKEWVKAFKASRQSTLILFSGKEQLWFSVAERDKETIFDALDKAQTL